ncbi:hypothetical protein HZS_3614 [Henneguya salminicola]|nr:hypothetical protein HZS_3614 [Henneguya salminicola]
MLCNRKYNIVGGINDNGKILTKLASSRNRACLRENIHGSKIQTGKWPIYRNLEKDGNTHEINPVFSLFDKFIRFKKSHNIAMIFMSAIKPHGSVEGLL